MSIRIEFIAWVGDNPYQVEIGSVMGAGDSLHLHMYVNRYYWGAFFKMRDEWCFPSCLHGDDVTILLDIIEEELRK